MRNGWLQRRGDAPGVDPRYLAVAAMAGAAVAGLARARRPPDPQANRYAQLAQMDGTPVRRYYTGPNPDHAIGLTDLRARAHHLMPRLVMEYIEGGAEDEASMMRERQAFADWRFVPRTLVDVSNRSLQTRLLGGYSAMPLVVAPTGLNGLIMRHADIALARAAAKIGVPFVQSTMSNDAVEDVAKVKGLRHWWQLYVFGGDEIWRQLLDRADRAGCEALVLTTNTQIYGNREWSLRVRHGSRPTPRTTINAALHPRWLATTMLPDAGLPVFKNVIDFVPKQHRGFFESSSWIRDNQPQSLSWKTLAKIREFWKKPILIKGILSIEDVRRAMDSGVEGIVLSSHGGRQLDWTISPLDLLPAARAVVGDRMQIYVAGGIRRGTDLLKAVALGADAAFAGRAGLYGLCAYGERGAERALNILKQEADEAMGLVGAPSLKELNRQYLIPASRLPLASEFGSP